MNSTRHAAHTHACKTQVDSALALCSDLLCNNHTHGCGSNCRSSCLLRAWSGCSVITGFLATHEFWCNPGDIAARCPGTGSTWQVMLDSPHMPAAHSLLLQACSGCSMGTGFAQQHSSTLRCGTILIQQYQVSRHTAHALCAQPLHARLQQVLLQACAHLFVTATDFDHSPQGCSSRADQHNPACKAAGEVWARCTYLTLCLPCFGNHARLLPASAGFSPTCTALLMLAHQPSGYG
jgi:hypothetical protein